MSRIHPGVPVILRTRAYDRWRDSEETERLPLDLVRPYESEETEIYKANPQVGNGGKSSSEGFRLGEKAFKNCSHCRPINCWRQVAP